MGCMRATNDKPAAGSYIWNSIGGMLNALQSVVVLMVITRTCGLADAGIYSIAFATGNLFMYLGNYGVRNYQVSDLRQQYAFQDYLWHRCVTILLMLAASAFYCTVNYASGSYSPEKTAIVLAMCVLKTEDCIEEVFEGRLHQNGRLDLAGKMMTVRILVSIGGMMAALVLTKSLFLSTLAAIVLAFGSFLFMAIRYRREIAWSRGPFLWAKTAGLLAACFPVCAANFLSFYLINAPKYAIDAAMSEEVQAEYNFIAMPVFVIQLLTMFIYQPVMVRMTTSYRHRERMSFLREFMSVVRWLLVLSAAVLFGAYLLGIPALSALYATDLTALKGDLMLILLGSVFLAMNGFYSAVLTLMRMQNRIPVYYLIGAILSLILTPHMVATGGITGAVTAFTWIMVLVCALLTMQFIAGVRHIGKELL